MFCAEDNHFREWKLIVPVAMTFALFIGLVLVVFCTSGFRHCSEDQIPVV